MYNSVEQPSFGFRASRTLPGYFKARGYKTYGIGKVWDTEFLRKCAAARYDDAKDLWDISPRSQFASVEKQQCQTKGIGNEGGGGCVHASDAEIIDTQIVSSAIDVLEKHPSSHPFFMVIGLRKPHAPFESTTEDLEKYESMPVSLPDESCFRQGR